MPKLELSNGVKLHYQIAGSGPPLVMIHGLTGNLAVWHLKMVPELMDDFRVLTYDLRGHGYSSIPPRGYTLDDMAADLGELLTHLELDNPVIVGHSYGADIALAHPERVRQVIAIEAALPAMVHERSREDWVGWDTWAETLAQAGLTVPADKRSDIDYLLRTSLELPKKWGPLKGLPRDAKKYLRLLEETTISADFDTIGSLTLDRIPDVTVPVTLMYAENGAFFATYDYLLQHLPNATSILLPQTEWGHFGPLEQPEIVAAHIKHVAQR